jgi:uncharacterized protein YndB with AHSA1/START domain
MMADILHMVPIETEPEEVFRAITQPEDLAAWWTSEVKAQAEVGKVAEFRFEGGQVVMRMKVVEFDRPSTVRWQVEDPAPPEWGGTQVTWNITPSDEGVHLLFGHRDWDSTEGSFAAINYNWAYYLTSLKQYLETGQGFPHES